MNEYIEQIKKDGYCIIPEFYSEFVIDKLLTDIKQLYEKTKDTISKDTPYLNLNQPNVYNLQNKKLFFIDLLLGNKQIEEILIYFLNDKWYKQIPQDKPNYILRSYGARSSNEALPLHIDSFIPYKGDEVIAMQVAIVLEDQTEENGCTVVVPGTHQSGQYADNKTDLPIIPLTPKAGDIVIWDSRLWHGTTKNQTQGTRWAIISTFCRYWLKQQFNIPEDMKDSDIVEKLIPQDKSILGFNSIPPINEYEGIEMKKGYKL